MIRRQGFALSGSNRRGVGRETEGVVENNGAGTISELGATLRVTIDTPSGEVFVPQKSTPVHSLMVAAGMATDGHESFNELESRANIAAKLLPAKINQMSVSSLTFGR